MKRLFTVMPILVLCLTVTAFGQATKWQFVKVFPDTNIAFGVGVHGIAVDKANKVWVTPFGRTNNDSIAPGVGVVAVYVYNPDGTETPISRIKRAVTTGRIDTFFSSGSIRGARADMDGNIVIAGYFNSGGDGSSKGHIIKLNYQTGDAMVHVGITGSQTAPAFTNANEMFTANVGPGNPIRIWNGSDFSSLGQAVASSVGYSRTLECSKDGNDIYWCGYDKKHVKIYHSDIGTLGTYALTDSFAVGMQVESTGWNKKDGYLYVSSGTVDTTDYGLPPVDPPWQPLTWYAMDVTTKAVKDSIVWNNAAYPYPLTVGANMPRPRGIDFSVSGDTAYVACYNFANAAIQMFKRVLVSVEPLNNLVPENYTLSQNFPNPFNPTTQIEFSIPKAGFTTVKVYDMLGKEVATLVNENLNPGTFRTTLDGSKLSSGTYVYQMISGSTRITKKMMLVK